MTKSSILRPALVVGVAYLALLAVFSTVHGYQALDFAHLGTVWGEHDPDGTWGYDGQFYYQMAKDPFGAVEFMDNAPLRYQRIVYPLLARLLSLGRPAFIPYALLFINWASIVLGVELLSRLLRAQRLNRWFSLAYGLYFGQVAGFAFDTTEPFAFALVCSGIWLWHKKRANRAALLFGLAALSKETAALFAIGYLAFFLLQREWKEAIRVAALGILPLVCWLVTLWFIFGETGVAFTPPFERVPFYGIFFYSQAPRKFWLLLVLMFVPTVGAWILAGMELMRRRSHPLLFAWLANIALITFLSRFSYIELNSCGRNSIGLVLAYVAYGATTRNKPIVFASQFYAFTFLVYLAGVLLGIRSLLL
jgi:hypothetical protein